jgi:hypothetical protein
MNDSAICYNNPSHTLQSTTSNYSFYLLRDLSSTSKYLYIELRRIAGVKGYLSYSATDLSEIVGRSVKQTRRLLHELEANGLVEIWLHPGRESEYVIPDVYFRGTLDKNVPTFKKKSFKNKKTVRENGASLSIVKPDPKNIPRSIQAQTAEITSRYFQEVKNDFRPDPIGTDPREEPELSVSEQTTSEPVIEPRDTHISLGKSDIVQVQNSARAKPPIRMDIVSHIIAVTGDKKSLAFWIKMVKGCDLQTIRYCLSALNVGLNDGTVRHPGRYLTSLFKKYAPELFSSQKTISKSYPTTKECANIPLNTSKTTLNSPFFVDWEGNLARIRALKAILAEKRQ